MKKSRKLFVFLFFLIGTLYGENSGERFDTGSFRKVSGGEYFTCRLNGLNSERILSSLDRGDTIRIRLWVREWTDTGSGWKKETVQTVYTVHASWNVIDKMYVIEEAGEKRKFFLHKDAFLDELLTFQAVPLKEYSPSSGISIRADILWQVLTPPLNILSPFLPGLRSSIPWTEVILPTDGNS